MWLIVSKKSDSKNQQLPFLYLRKCFLLDLLETLDIVHVVSYMEPIGCSITTEHLKRLLPMVLWTYKSILLLPQGF